jgi:hypothetical protein
VPPIQNVGEINEQLKNVIAAIQLFKTILPHVRNVKRFLNETEELNNREAYRTLPSSTDLYCTSRPKVERFLEEIKAYLPLLQTTFSNEDMHKKLMYYFIGEGGLINGLVYFSQQKDGDLGLNLRNAECYVK